MVPLMSPSLFDEPAMGDETEVAPDVAPDVEPELLGLPVFGSRISKAPVAPRFGGFPLRLLVPFVLLAFLSGLRVLFFMFEPPGWLLREVFFSRKGR